MPRKDLSLADIDPSIRTADVVGALIEVRCSNCFEKSSIQVENWPHDTGEHPSFVRWLEGRTCERCGSIRLRLGRIRHPETNSPFVFRARTFRELDRKSVV